MTHCSHYNFPLSVAFLPEKHPISAHTGPGQPLCMCPCMASPPHPPCHQLGKARNHCSSQDSCGSHQGHQNLKNPKQPKQEGYKHEPTHTSLSTNSCFLLWVLHFDPLHGLDHCWAASCQRPCVSTAQNSPHGPSVPSGKSPRTPTEVESWWKQKDLIVNPGLI